MIKNPIQKKGILNSSSGLQNPSDTHISWINDAGPFGHSSRYCRRSSTQRFQTEKPNHKESISFLTQKCHWNSDSLSNWCFSSSSDVRIVRIDQSYSWLVLSVPKSLWRPGNQVFFGKPWITRDNSHLASPEVVFHWFPAIQTPAFQQKAKRPRRWS